MENLPDGKKHHLRPFKKRRTYIRENRHFSKEELLEYLRKNNFRSAHQLEVGRKPCEPNVYDYRKEFGNWENARSAVFGIRTMDFGFNAHYLLKTVIEFNLWTVRAYQAKRILEPDIFPSLRQIRKKWGGKWSIMVGAAKQLSFKATLDAYKKLWRRLGRKPTMEDASIAGISLESVLRYYKRKEELDKMIETWEGSKDEGETGST